MLQLALIALPIAFLVGAAAFVRTRATLLVASPWGRELLRTLGAKNAALGTPHRLIAALVNLLIAVGLFTVGTVAQGIGDQWCCDGDAYLGAKYLGWTLIGVSWLFGLAALGHAIRAPFSRNGKA